jgi:tRNA(Ile)-lysidine synthase
MVSGGADSLALLFAFARLKDRFSPVLRCSVLHIHHGLEGVSTEVRAFRQESERLVTESAERMGLAIEVVKNPHSGDLSEDQARTFRQAQVNAIFDQDPQRIFVWGHHREDLLETRFMRLLRGTGIQGLEAMQVFRAPHFRPWLTVSRAAIEESLVTWGESWVQDPDQENLRSWLRRELFPQIEARQAGSLGALARSLEQLAQSGAETELEVGGDLVIQSDGSLSHPRFQCLSVEQQRRTLARYLYGLGRRDYTRGQIQEVLKRLDKDEIGHRFTLMGLDWHVNAEQIRALPALK